MSILKELDLLSEGFSAYTVGGSDTAADLFADACDKMAGILQAALKDKGNEYNTPGYINVGMIFDEFLMPFSGRSDRLSQVAKMTLHLLQDEAQWAKKHKSDNVEQNAIVNKLITKLKKFK